MTLIPAFVTVRGSSTAPEHQGKDISHADGSETKGRKAPDKSGMRNTRVVTLKYVILVHEARTSRLVFSIHVRFRR